MSDKILSIKSLGYSIYASELEDLPKKHQTLVNTINQYSYCIAERDVEFKTALQQSDVLLPDGVAIVKAVKLVSDKNIKKIAGADLHQYCLEKLNKEHGSCFYLGSSVNTLENIEKRLKIEYPNIRAGYFSPPYKAVFSEKENSEMISAVNNFKPDVLFIGMTAPKQEKWAYTLKNKLNVQLICSIGAVFDFYAGTVKRPGKVWVNMGLEWLGRLVKEPKRMWKRYLYYGPIFIYYIFNKKLKNLIKHE